MAVLIAAFNGTDEADVHLLKIARRKYQPIVIIVADEQANSVLSTDKKSKRVDTLSSIRRQSHHNSALLQVCS